MLASVNLEPDRWHEGLIDVEMDITARGVYVRAGAHRCVMSGRELPFSVHTAFNLQGQRLEGALEDSQCSTYNYCTLRNFAERGK